MITTVKFFIRLGDMPTRAHHVYRLCKRLVHREFCLSCQRTSVRVRQALMSCYFFLAAGAVDRKLADAIRTVSVCLHSPGQDADNQRHSQVLRSELHNAAHRPPTVHPTGTA